MGPRDEPMHFKDEEKAVWIMYGSARIRLRRPPGECKPCATTLTGYHANHFEGLPPFLHNRVPSHAS